MSFSLKPLVSKPTAPLITGAQIPEDHVDRPLLGMGMAVAAYFLLAVMNVFAKLLSDHIHVVEVAFYRNLIALLPFVIYLSFTGWQQIMIIELKRLKFLIARSVFGVLSLIITFAAFAAMPMADTTAFLFTSSLFLPILCVIFLKEHVGPYRWAAILIGFAGAIIMAAPTGAVNYMGITLALSAAFMHGVLGTLLRHLGKTERIVVIMFFFLGVGTIVSGLALPFVSQGIPSPELWPWLIGVGLSGMFAQLCLSMAFKYAPAALVTIFNYTGIIWATVFGWFIWNDWPAWPIWCGGAVVILSNLFIVWREQRRKKEV